MSMFGRFVHAAARRAGFSASASVSASVSASASTARAYVPTATRIAAAAFLGTAVYYSYDSVSLSALRNELYTRYAVHAEAAVGSADNGSPENSRVDDATAVPHPLILKPASAPDLALVGLGVRTVSFLKMKVYSAGFYVDDYTLKRLKSLPIWGDYTPDALKSKRAEELIRAIFDAPGACAVRIVPVRNTDFAHLRDGLTRTLLQRQRVQRSAGQLTPDDDTRLDSAIQVFKTVFPVGSVPKGKQLVLVRSADGFLHIEYQGKILGSVHDKWMADNVMLAYFDYISPISPALRDSTADGFETWVKK